MSVSKRKSFKIWKKLYNKKITKLSNQSVKELLDKSFLPEIVFFISYIEKDELYAVKIISKTHLKKKPFL